MPAPPAGIAEELAPLLGGAGSVASFDPASLLAQPLLGASFGGGLIPTSSAATGPIGVTTGAPFVFGENSPTAQLTNLAFVAGLGLVAWLVFRKGKG